MAGMFAQLFRTGDLESTSDNEYERLRARASARNGDGAALAAASAAVGAALAWGFGGILIAWMVTALSSQPGNSGGGAPTIAGRVWTLNILFALLAGFLAMRLTYEWRLAKAMRRVQNKAGCPYCEFSLVGLKAEMGAVTCPECGQLVVLAEHHIPPDALYTQHSGPPVSDAGPLGSFTGQVPKGRERMIRRQYGGIPSRQQQPAARPDAPGGGEFLSE